MKFSTEKKITIVQSISIKKLASQLFDDNLTDIFPLLEEIDKQVKEYHGPLSTYYYEWTSELFKYALEKERSKRMTDE